MQLNDILDKLINVDGFYVKDYNPIFLSNISRYLINLKKLNFDEILLSDLLIQKDNIFRFPVFRKLKHSRVLKALNGYAQENDRYIQENLIDKTNEDRVIDVFNNIKEIGYYPNINNEYIILFNDKDYIADGQHRAASLYYLYGGDIKIKVIRFYFKNDLYNPKWYSNLHVWFIRRKVNTLILLKFIYKRRLNAVFICKIKTIFMKFRICMSDFKRMK
ncbi:MAG: hypothetical protein LBF82_02960, partial [Lactobacillales bacterium]|nr:hypothetical protein [Lactobacillales bacterium]